MELELKNLNDQDIKSTGKTIKMKMSDDAQSFIFQMFTDDIYKNPVGSIVREITSNCFDSHVEAGTESPDNPVMVKHSIDNNCNPPQHYISFFDKGVGMSPDRIENIYGVYFESTKRNGNEQIGGFGIGGKSPLAYTDSFTVITRFNGMEYGYNIYKGSEAPAINEQYSITTKEVNGTEVRIPIKEQDLSKFEREIKRQLYYFENIVFVGFDDDEKLNNYNVYKGEHFLYRGKNYEPSIHVCLGKVAYKIDYSDCGLSEYKYAFPLALKFDIGDIKVTPNRESLSYKDITVKMINEKIALVKKELSEMLSKQYENVRTLKEYYTAKENFGQLTFSDNNSLNVKGMFNKKDINYTNFKYNDLPFIPTSESALELLYNVHEYGKKGGYWGGIKVKMDENSNRDNIYQCPGEFKRKLVKQSYLSNIHNKNFVIMKPYDLFNDINSNKLEKVLLAFGCIEEDKITYSLLPKIPATKAHRLLKGFVKEFKAWVGELFESYDGLVVPEDFIKARKEERLSKEILNTTIPLRNGGAHGYRSRVSIKNIMNFKGRIFYSSTDEEHIVRDGKKIFEAMFGNKHVDTIQSYKNSFTNGKGIAFVSCANGNLKYLKMCPNAYHIDLLYPILLRRKMINPANIEAAIKFVNRYDDLDGMYKGNFGKVNTKVARYRNDIENEIEELKMYNQYSYINFDHHLITKYVNKETKQSINIRGVKKMNWLLKMQEDNKDVIKWINIPYYYNDNLQFQDNENHNNLVKLLKKIMVFK